MLRSFRHLRAAFRRQRLDRNLRDEMAQHLEWKTQAYIDSGLSAEEARRRAAVDVGNVTRLREDARAVWGFPTLDSAVQDVQYGARLLRRSPVFSLVAIVSLAIGIGASAAVFTLADAVLFRKLAVRDPDGLVVFRWSSGPALPFSYLNGYADQTDSGQTSTSFSLAAFVEMQRAAAPVADVFGFADLYRVNVSVDGRAELTDGHVVSGNYFSVLGVPPLLGRPLMASDDTPTAPAAAVISEALWRRAFDASPGAVGRAIAVNGASFTVVGVMPASFGGTGQVGQAADVFVPLSNYSLVQRLGQEPRNKVDDPGFWWVLVMARPHDGVAPSGLQPIVDSVMKRTTAAAKPSLTAKDLPGIELLPGARGQVEDRNDMRDPLRTMTAVVVIVLLVACANVANLLLARGRARARELAVRVAIGAPRRRVVRQLLTEGLLLAACGSVFGVLLARWIAVALLPALSGSATLAGSIGVNGRLLGFVVLLASTCAVLFGLAPALRASDVPVSAGLQEAGRGAAAGLRGARLSSALVVAQIGLSMTLVAAAGLIVRSVRNLERVPLGFDAHQVLLFRIDPALNGYPDERVRQVYAQVLSRLRSAPGVGDATLSSHTLISSTMSTGTAVAQGEATPPLESPDARSFAARHDAMRLVVDGHFFATMGIPLLRGRALADSDSSGAQRVAVVNRALARQLYGADDVVGRTFRFGLAPTSNATVAIVGVVADARYSSLRRPMMPTAYPSYRQWPASAATFEVKTKGDPDALAGTARQIVRSVDPTLPLSTVRSQDDQIAEALRQERLFARLATLLGTVTLALSAIGLYGLLAYAVSRRTPEIGIRMALGADRSSVARMVLRQCVVIAVIGLGLGVAGALAGARLIASLLYGLPPRDPLTITLSGAVMLVTAMAAGLLPARRASRVDPLIALRAE